jgi:P27 family predicted phage terminase small subunit
MGRRGPQPKPTNLRLLHGDRKDRINVNEPQPVDGLPKCPDGTTAEVRVIWDYTLSHLGHMRLATPADRDALLAYCEAVWTHRRASELMAKSSVLIQGLHGGLVRNPALQIQRDAAMVMRAYAHEFGLTPAARSQISYGPGEVTVGGPSRLLSGS